MCTKTKSEIPDPLKAVRFDDSFLGRLVERTVTRTLPHVLQQCREEGIIRNVAIAAGRSDGEYSGGGDRDSDLFKVMEGAAYCLHLTKDEKAEGLLDSLIATLAAAQQSDGYLQTYFSSQAPDERYADLQRSHELYCAGHLMEAAVAHFEATGKTSLLDVARKLADHVDATFGPGKLEIPPGHQEIELALVRLYHATGETRYLDLSRYFIDLRGNPAMVKREYGGKLIVEDDRTPGRNRPPEYRQDHLPIVEQRFATGHAVRAGYTYAALADIAAEYGSDAHASAAKAIWENIVGKKLYLSGGVGTHQYHDEGYGDDYVLPNTGYCETCGGIAFMLFSHRMGLLTGEAKYADVVETVFYNHLLSSTDISGCNTFYRNPLSSQGPRARQPWNHPACCPTNVVRIVPQFPRLMYGVAGNSIFVDQFAGSTATVRLDAGVVSLTQTTNYPWDGRISLSVKPETPARFALHIRIPGWVNGTPVPSDLYKGEVPREPVAISVNGKPVDLSACAGGYCVVERTWQPDDTVVVDLPMPIQRIHAHAKVDANTGRVALMRGPLLYCFEEMDIGMDPEEMTLSPDEDLKTEYMPDLLGGVTAITDGAGRIKAVPFNVWNNRNPGRMAVWVREDGHA